MGEEGGRRGREGPQEPAKITGNPAVQKAVDFLIRFVLFVILLIQIDEMAFQGGVPGVPRGLDRALGAWSEPWRPAWSPGGHFEGQLQGTASKETLFF